MPRIFVPGPNVNPSIGSPLGYLQGIQKIFADSERNNLFQERTENTKLFQDATTALNERKQDFTEAAPARTEALRVAALARDTDKVNTVQNFAEGAQYAGGDRFDSIRGELLKDPRFAGLDEAGQLAAQNEYILKNPTSVTPPKQFRETLRKGLASTGKFTAAELETVVANEVNRRYPTGDADLVKAQLLKPKDLGASAGSNNVTIGGKLFSGTKGGSYDFVSNPVNQGDKTEQMKAEFELLGLGDKRTKSTLGISHELAAVNPINPFGNFDFNVTQQGYSKAISKLEGAGLSVSEAIGVLRDEIDGDLESSLDFENLAPGDVTRLATKAAGIKAQQTQLFNKKGGDISAAGQATGGIFSPAQAANAAAAHNQRLLSTLIPQADSDSEIITSFLDRLGASPTNTPRQGDNQGGGNVITPEVVTPDPAQVVPPVVTPAPGEVDGLRQNGMQSIPQPQAEFQIGGPVEPDDVFGNQLFSGLQNVAAKNPASIFANAAKDVAPSVAKLFQSLTLPGPGVLTPQNLPQANAALAGLQEEGRVGEIKAELAKLPPKGERNLVEGQRARSLEIELRNIE